MDIASQITTEYVTVAVALGMALVYAIRRFSHAQSQKMEADADAKRADAQLPTQFFDLMQNFLGQQTALTQSINMVIQKIDERDEKTAVLNQQLVGVLESVSASVELNNQAVDKGGVERRDLLVLAEQQYKVVKQTRSGVGETYRTLTAGQDKITKTVTGNLKNIGGTLTSNAETMDAVLSAIRSQPTIEDIIARVDKHLEDAKLVKQLRDLNANMTAIKDRLTSIENPPPNPDPEAELEHITSGG